MATDINKIWKKIIANVDIDLSDMVVTYKTVTRILISIIEFLSYNRQQIPMVFQSFNYLVKKNLEHQPNSDVDTFSAVKIFALERQKDLAIKTNQSFREISDIVAETCKQYEIQQAVIGFGATTFTVKESFVINLPHISKGHVAQNHFDSPQMITRKVIMSIISSNRFFEANSTDLKPTKMFVFLKPKCADTLLSDAKFIRRDLSTLPLSSCRTTVFNIINPTENLAINCCKDLKVYSDAPQADSIEPITHKSIDADRTHENATTFYECNVSVKGFKDQLIKGKSIWS